MNSFLDAVLEEVGKVLIRQVNLFLTWTHSWVAFTFPARPRNYTACFPIP